MNDNLLQERCWPIDWELSALRARVRLAACRAGLTSRRADDLVIAVHEAALNVLEHGGGRGCVYFRHDQDSITVHVIDICGRLSADHLPDQPSWSGASGNGLWLMRQACDELTIDSRPGRGVVRLRMYLSADSR
ncbi:ATP-binding protein [Nonomuraea jiangxiensis]|uniref:Anti-sigma regulatory factor (Ser/Thr protein kinase) n=1 Tax=Nonomuraea jiangxiensis TaxID=633440 RepID=A0A1G8TN96_9ACTN|nr:ATP-binding protein [Nonomuraea jiangxiensis]SDJ42998.1 Anti-sigma regulatory factor (Ser/Thr protein kinase) [Nonomuraea jiangxiensis]